jgi:hypothetical protein
MKRIIGISEAAEVLGVSVSTLRVADLDSGMNYHKRGLKRLLTGILDDPVGRLVLAHKDHLLRFGAEPRSLN